MPWMYFFFVRQKTGYEMRMSDWSSDVCSSDRLGFKEKHALETLPKTIAGLQKQIAEYQAALADAQLFSRNPAKFQAATAGLEKAGADLAVAEDQWLALEMLREALES